MDSDACHVGNWRIVDFPVSYTHLDVYKRQSLYRASDLTLADLVHGLSKKERKNGASLVLVNTGKGKRRLEQCDLYKKQLDIAYAVKIQSHLSHPQKMSGQRSEILESLDRLPFSEVADRYLTPPAVPFRVRVKGGIKRLLGR